MSAEREVVRNAGEIVQFKLSVCITIPTHYPQQSFCIFFVGVDKNVDIAGRAQITVCDNRMTAQYDVFSAFFVQQANQIYVFGFHAQAVDWRGSPGKSL